MNCLQWLATTSLLLSACTSAPVGPLPEPLPETLEWATPTSSGAFLGLHTRENDSGSLDELFFLPGVRVFRVVENSPAAAAGVRIGDVVLKFGASDVNDPDTLESLLQRAEASSQVTLEIQRGDSVFSVPVTIGAESGEQKVPVTVRYRMDPSRSRAGWSTHPEGAMLASMDPRGPVGKKGLELGTIVRAVDGNRVHSGRDLVKRFEACDPGQVVKLDIQSPGQDPSRCKLKLLEPDTRVTDFSIPILFNYSADIDGSEAGFALLDLWIISLFRYERSGQERTWRFLRFFEYSTGIGELSE